MNNQKTKSTEPAKLLPVVFLSDKDSSTRHKDERSKCLFLLKALRVTQDPKQLAAMMGIKRVAEVYRTLDKLAMRREYHEALVQHGIDFSYIVRQFKDVVENGKNSEKLIALKTLLKSVGMDEYKESSGVADGGWEEILNQKVEKMKSMKAEIVDGTLDYDVEIPQTPPDVRLLSTESGER